MRILQDDLLITSSLILFAETLFLKKVSFTGFRGWDMDICFGGHHLANCSLLSWMKFTEMAINRWVK